MISTRSVIHADFLSQIYRVSCRLQVPQTGLMSTLNDINSSLVDVEDAYFSRLMEPAKILWHFEHTHLHKANVALVLLARREDLGPTGLARAGYTKLLPISVLLATVAFEIRGTIEVVHKLDAAELLVGGTGRFIAVYNAEVAASQHPESPFSAAAILVNRTQVEALAPLARAKP